MTEFTLIRHGETVENLAGIIQGHFNSELNDIGREQAEAVAKRLAVYGVDKICDSASNRAIETAQPLWRAAGQGLGAAEACQGNPRYSVSCVLLSF